MTYGQLRLQIKQQAPGVSLELIDGWFADRYTEILDRLDWTRSEARVFRQIAVSYAVGTLTATNGLNTITGAGTVWTTAMTGRMIRIAGDSQFYQFTYVSGTSGTLDRTYEGAGGAGLTYRIDQNIVAMPAEARIIGQVSLQNPARELVKWSSADLGASFPNRNIYGTPVHWAPIMDSQTTTPALQIELTPVPELATSLLVSYSYDETPPSTTGASLLSWVRASAIKAGVMTDVSAFLKDWNAVAFHQARFDKLALEMEAADGMRRGGAAMCVAPWLIRHQGRR